MNTESAIIFLMAITVITIFARVLGMSIYMTFHMSAFASDRERIDTIASGVVSIMFIVGQADIVVTNIGEVMGFARSFGWSLTDLLAGIGFLRILQTRRQFYHFVEEQVCNHAHNNQA